MSRPTIGRLNRIAEEYYKNDYPDEESSDYGSSEGDDGACPRIFCLSFFSLEAALYIVDLFLGESDEYDGRDWR